MRQTLARDYQHTQRRPEPQHGSHSKKRHPACLPAHRIMSRRSLAMADAEHVPDRRAHRRTQRHTDQGEQVTQQITA